MRGIVLLLLLLSSLPALADYLLLNKPGERVDVASKLVKGKQNLVVFHSDAHGISRRMISEYKALGERRQDLAVLIVNINQVGSPVARQYNVTAVPSVQIYDAQGRLTMQGAPAYNESMKWLSAGR